MLERLRLHAETASTQTDDVTQHQAFVELLVAAIYADRRITQHELDTIEAFDSSHPDWDVAPFSVRQYFGPAVAKVRQAHAAEGIADLIADIAGRLSNGELRKTALAACSDLLESDGSTGDEHEFLRLAGAALG
jgi:uncharacterized protein YlxP (DUF503 family)